MSVSSGRRGSDSEADTTGWARYVVPILLAGAFLVFSAWLASGADESKDESKVLNAPTVGEAAGRV